MAIIGIVAAIAVPGLMRARMSGNEASAIGSLRAVNSAEASYASSCGQGSYAGTLADLGKPPQADRGIHQRRPDLRSVEQERYTIALTAGAAAPSGVTGCNSPGAIAQTYFVAGRAPGGELDRVPVDFGTNQGGTIY